MNILVTLRIFKEQNQSIAEFTNMIDPLVLKNIGYLVAYSEVGPQVRNALIQHSTDSQIDSISSVCVNVIFENIDIKSDTRKELSKFGPLMLMLADRTKGRSLKRTSLMRYPRFLTILFKSIRSDLLQQLKQSI